MGTKKIPTPEHFLPDGLSEPALRALLKAKITRVEHLAKFTEAELMKMHGMGPKALDLLRKSLRATGESFAKK
jgi:ERCC4-type nuclease